MRRLQTSFALLVVLLVGAGIARAELQQEGNLRLKFNGRLAPKKLPRSASAPVIIRVHGASGTADGGKPPQLRRVAFAFNRYGTVSTKGLPVCDQGVLE